MTQARRDRAAVAAVGYLVDRQDASGCWRDYRLPVGVSDEWVTALVGFACAEAAPALHGSRSGDASNAAWRALEWLVGSRAYDAGWGFNGSTGPDADSTAWAMRLHDALGQSVRTADVDFLLGHWHARRGFATFRRADAWGAAHPDVTPVAALALPVELRARLQPDLLAAVAASRSADGTWPSYWWRSRHYATAANGELLASWGLAPLCSLIVDTTSGALHSHLDAACALMTAEVTDACDAATEALASGLMAAQRPDGSWDGSDDLRVTDPRCHNPWETPAGQRYRDIDAFVTTATSLRALVRPLVAPRGDGKQACPGAS
jgi:hypothetical protein